MKTFRQFLSEGGNATVFVNGEAAHAAESMDVTKHDRTELVNAFQKTLSDVNVAFYAAYGFNLWDHYDLSSGKVFAGSSKFFVDTDIPDEEFVKHKPTVGDVDVQIPDVTKDLVDKLLVVGKSFGPMKYLGRSDTSPMQLNTVWEYETSEGHVLKVQLDFEPVEWHEGSPSPWSEFAHSADWDDIKSGVKGVFHKYLIGSIDFAWPRQITVLTKKTMKAKKVDTHDYAFSVDRGLRGKYVLARDEKGKQIEVDGQPAFFEVDTKDAEYTTDLASIYEVLFRIVPTTEDLKKFKSFIGVVQLLDQELDGSQQSLVADEFLKRCWGKGAQQLTRDDPEADARAKWAAVELLADELKMPSVLKKADEMVAEFYKGYKMSSDRVRKNK